MLHLLTSFLLEDIIFNKKFKQKFGNPQAEGFNYYSSTRLQAVTTRQILCLTPRTNFHASSTFARLPHVDVVMHYIN